jgi:hypothetical protein
MMTLLPALAWQYDQQSVASSSSAQAVGFVVLQPGGHEQHTMLL